MELVKQEYRIAPVQVAEPAFRDVLGLRASAYGRDEAGKHEEVDDYSMHFAAYTANGRIVGAVRATCRKDGPLESEAYYPKWLLEEFSTKLSAVSRLCVDPAIVGSRLPHDLTQFAWSMVLPLGIRIDVSKARVKAIPFYLKMGHFFVREATFQFDRWNAKCGFVACPANAEYGGVFSSIFSTISDPCDLSLSPNFNLFTRSYRDFIAETKGHETRRMIDEGSP